MSTAHGSSSEIDKKSNNDDDFSTFNAENLQNNMKIIYYSRTFLSIIGGVIAGILGFTSLTGFIFYFLVMATASLGLAAKAKFSAHAYFDCWNRIILDGFLSGLLSFVLFWTNSIKWKADQRSKVFDKHLNMALMSLVVGFKGSQPIYRGFGHYEKLIHVLHMTLFIYFRGATNLHTKR